MDERGQLKDEILLTGVRVNGIAGC